MEDLDKFSESEIYLLELIKCKKLGRLSLTIAGILLGISLTKSNWILGYLISMSIQYLVLLNLTRNVKECLIPNYILNMLMLKSGLILFFYILASKILLYSINTSITIALVITISIFIHRVIINIILKEPFLYHIFKSIQLALVISRDNDKDYV